MSKVVGVVTTINQPSEAVTELARLIDVVVVADRKTPGDWTCDSTRFLSTEDQTRLPLQYAAHTPINHYARKNVGYLKAMLDGAEVIYDTDDDNVPSGWWSVRNLECEATPVRGPAWCNVYNRLAHSSCTIWPRGLPLDEIFSVPQLGRGSQSIACPIQQGVADNEPDVDAIWRLTKGGLIHFDSVDSLALEPGVWCPFNSQSTWWWPEVYPLLYLPATVPFRMTDIWRSFVAQRCLWASGRGLVAHHAPAEVVQYRNKHDLMEDFRGEIEGYLHNKGIVEILSRLELGVDACNNLVTCYSTLVNAGFVDKRELPAIDAWIGDVRKMTR